MGRKQRRIAFRRQDRTCEHADHEVLHREPEVDQRRNEHDRAGRCLLDRRAAVEEREVLSRQPEREEIAKVRSRPVAGLAGRVDRNRVVPAADVEHHAKRRARS